jgi:hypothetical protein
MSKNDPAAVLSQQYSMSLLIDNINLPPQKIYFSYASEEHMPVWEGAL